MRPAPAILVAIAAVVLTGMATPAQEAKEGLKALMRADTNGDGSVTFEELSGVRPNVTRDDFKRLDRNADGLLTRADRQQPGAGAVERIRRCDTDHDGRVSFEEFSAGFPKATRERFDALDRNKDGVLTREDAPRPQETATPGPELHARRQMAMRLRQADADRDGRVTFEEVTKAKPGFPRADFDRFDTDKDGALTSKDAQPGRNPEARKGPGQRLQAADKDADGRVSLDEAKAARPDMTDDQFRRLDRNADGFLSREDRAEQ